MDGSTYRKVLHVGAGLATGLSSSLASAAVAPYRPGGVADAALPAELATMIWLPILILSAVCGLALIWMLTAERREQRRLAALERQQIAAQRRAYRRAVDQYLSQARRTRAQARRESRERRLTGAALLGHLAGSKA